MFTGPPYTWVEVPYDIDNMRHTLRGKLIEPNSITPNDIAEYLVCMNWGRHTVGTKEYWRQNDCTSSTYGYFTWEQAVAYCIVRPFLNRDTK